MTATFHGQIEEDHFVAADVGGWKRQLRSMNGARVTVRISKLRQPRSLDQNSYYWGCVVPMIGEYCGYPNDEMHEALKFRFLKVGEDGFERVLSTADLDTRQFSDYVERVRQLAAELGVVIPDPGERACV